MGWNIAGLEAAFDPTLLPAVRSHFTNRQGSLTREVIDQEHLGSSLKKYRPAPGLQNQNPSGGVRHPNLYF